MQGVQKEAGEGLLEERHEGRGTLGGRYCVQDKAGGTKKWETKKNTTKRSLRLSDGLWLKNSLGIGVDLNRPTQKGGLKNPRDQEGQSAQNKHGFGEEPKQGKGQKKLNVPQEPQPQVNSSGRTTELQMLAGRTSDHGNWTSLGRLDTRFRKSTFPVRSPEQGRPILVQARGEPKGQLTETPLGGGGGGLEKRGRCTRGPVRRHL